MHVHKQGNGRVTSAKRAIDCGAVCTTHATAGTRVRLAATHGRDAMFLGWDGPCTGTGPCEFTVHGDDVTVNARFADVPLPESSPLTVRPAGTGRGTVTSSPAGITCPKQCVSSFAQGTVVVLEESVPDGSRFVGWAGACTGTGRCAVTMKEAATVTARFDTLTPPAAPKLTIRRQGDGTVNSAPRGISCGLQCSASFPKGTTIALTAAAGARLAFRRLERRVRGRWDLRRRPAGRRRRQRTLHRRADAHHVERWPGQRQPGLREPL